MFSMDDEEVGIATKRRRKIGSRTCHCLLIVPLLAVVVLASVSLGIFFASEIQWNDAGSSQNKSLCVLYATYSSGESSLNSGPRIACDVSIWGEAALVVLEALLAAGMIIKAAAGVHVFNLLLVFELLIIGISLLGGLAFALNTTIGLAMTCDAWTHVGDGSESCAIDGSSFYYSILESEVAAWLAALVLLLLFVIYVTLILVYWRKCVQRRGRDHVRLLGETIQPSQKPKPSDYGSLNRRD